MDIGNSNPIEKENSIEDTTQKPTSEDSSKPSPSLYQEKLNEKSSTNHSLGSQRTLFSTTFSDRSEMSISSNLFSVASSEVEHPATKDPPENHGSGLSDEMCHFNQHEKEENDQLMSMHRKMKRLPTASKSYDTPSLGSEKTLFSTNMSNRSMRTISSSIFSTTSTLGQPATSTRLENYDAENASLSLQSESDKMSAQEVSLNWSQQSQNSINSGIFSDSAYGSLSFPIPQSQQKSSLKNSRNVSSNVSQIEGKVDSSLSKPSPMFPRHQENRELIEKLANRLDSLETSVMLISQSHDFVTYCASDLQAKVAVKVLRHNDKGVECFNRLKNEYEISHKMSHPNIRKSVQLRKFQNKQAIVLEWAEGNTVSECGKFDINNFLSVSTEILQAVVAMHKNCVMHKNLTADHIIVSFDPLRVNIIGFSLSDEFLDNNLQTIDQVEGDKSFMSPEKTGKLNHTVDYRSDFYNLGVIFYYMLAGKLPFSSENPNDLIDKHIFESPEPLHVFDCTIPRQISDMVSKLMEKSAEDRYQSAKGILYDLQSMSSEFEADASLISVILAEHDFSERLLVSQKLYGRSDEFEILRSAFERVSNGSIEIVFIEGKAGTGKTSFVSELRKHIARKKGYLITGKYDQSQRAQPFSALCEAFQQFFDWISLDIDGNLGYYKSMIQEVLGDEGKVLTDFIDNLRLIIGEQPNLAIAVGENSKNRFYYVFCNLVQAICTKDHPIVFFLDDLQWADLDSLKLLSALFSIKSVKNLLFIGAYRDEISETHSLFDAMQEMKDAKVPINHIKISNLSSKDVNDLISDTLHLPELDTVPLTMLVYEKTEGNAFFVNQFLKSLFNENLLHFSYEENKWEWDLDKFDSKVIASNVAELVMAKILKLNDRAKQVLKVASCIGNPFLLSTLILITDDSISVKQVISEGLILPIDARKTWHRFAHDHIQEAILSLISDNEKDDMHFKIGKSMWEMYLVNENDEYLFVTVNLLNSAVKIIRDQEELNRIARLNLRAGMKAFSSTAFKLALQYFIFGAKLLKDDCWEQDYDFSLKLYDAAAEAAYCAGDHDCMLKMMENVLQKATNFLHKIDCYSIQIRERNSCRKHREALDIGVYILRQLGENFSVEPTTLFVSEEVQKTLIMVRNQPAGEITMPMVHNKTVVYKMQILSDIVTASMYSCPALLPIVASRLIQLTFIHGVCKFSAVGFVVFSTVVCAKLEHFEEGYQIGQLSLMLLKMCGAKEMIPLTTGSYYGNVHHWSRSIHECMTPLIYSHRVGLEVGAFDVSLICANCFFIYSLLIGSQLEIIEEEMRAHVVRFSVKTSAILSVYQAVKNLLSESERNAAFLTGTDFDYRRSKEKSISLQDHARSVVISMMMSFFFHEYEKAFEFAEECRPLTKLFFGEYSYHNYVFYDGLIALAIGKHVKGRCNWRQIVQESISKLKKWSQTSVNHVNKLALLEAEMAALNNDKSEAMKLYDDAINLARNNKFDHEEALAYERAGIFYLEMKSVDKASQYLSFSCFAYMKWGAKAKVSHLKKMYPEFITEKDLHENSLSFNTPIYTQSSSVSVVSALSCVSEIFSPCKKKARTEHKN